MLGKSVPKQQQIGLNISEFSIGGKVASMRNVGCLAFLLLCSWAPSAQSETHALENSEMSETAAFFAAPFNALLRLYREALRQARPGICQMHPSDSAYAVQAIKKHGAGKGILLASDRIQRCGNDLKHYEPVIIDGKPFYSDPLP